MPWLCGLYVERHARGAHLGNMLMRHAEAETKHLSYTALFLSTDHVGYYERYGWEYIGNGYEPSGDPTRIYRKILT